MNRRRGVTLIEVMIAIFVMGLGLLAILSLFPLGASQMAQALRDQRCAEAAANGGALSRVIWKQACDDVEGKYPNDGSGRAFRDTSTTYKYPRSPQRFIMAMDDPNFDDNPNQATSSPYPGVNAAGACQLPEPSFFHRSGGGPKPYRENPSNPNDKWLMPMPDELARGQPSYPVFVDPIGWDAHGLTTGTGQIQRQYWVAAPLTTAAAYSGAIPQAGGKLGYIPRRPLYTRYNDPTGSAGIPDKTWVRLGEGLLQSRLFVQRHTTLMDDMTFTPEGQPKTTTGLGNAAVERQGRYSWAWLFRRPVNTPIGENRKTAEVYVVVYQNRPLNTPSAEEAFAATVVNPGSVASRQLTINFTGYNAGRRPAIRRGTWVLDATMYDAAGNANPQARFYRIVNVEEGVNSFTLETQTDIADSQSLQQRVIVVMDRVAEVFLKAQVGQNTPPQTY